MSDWKIHHWSVSEKSRVEGFIEDIVVRLRKHPRPEQSKNDVFNAVQSACFNMIVVGAQAGNQFGTAPGTAKMLGERQKEQIEKQKKLIKRLRAFADEGLSLMQEIQPNLEDLIFEEYVPYPIVDRTQVARGRGPDGSMKYQKLDSPMEEGNKQQFVRRLKRMRAVNYKPPHANRLYSKKIIEGQSLEFSGLVGERSAELAFTLVANFSSAKPVATKGRIFPTIAGLLYDVALPSPDGTLPELVRACYKVVNKHQKR